MPKRYALPLVALVAALALLPLAGVQAAPAVGFVPAWPGVKFTNPLGVVSAKDGTGALYVLEQAGTIQRVVGQLGAPVQPTVFLDITAKVFPRLQGGILGLAFHPAYAQNGRLFVCYVAETGNPQLPFKIVLSEFKGAGTACDPRTERVLLEIPKTLALHNGGCVAFGPDGKLYMSTGDNAKQKEALQTSQNPASLLGKILRLDVDRASPGLAYGIPADNPWAAAGGGVRPEIWAYGMRNPWRFSFDAKGVLWTGEPGTKGAECREWVMAVQRGQNHGWPFFQGTQPAEPVPPNLAGTPFVKPAFEYRRPDPEGQTAIIGGVVYRGSRVPALRGLYVFSDYGLGQIMSLDLSTGRGRDLQVLGKLARIASIDEDDRGELYLSGHEDGIIYTPVAR
jgi:glucose/arabinose dehydrogenase